MGMWAEWDTKAFLGGWGTGLSTPRSPKGRKNTMGEEIAGCRTG